MESLMFVQNAGVSIHIIEQKGFTLGNVTYKFFATAIYKFTARLENQHLAIGKPKCHSRIY